MELFTVLFLACLSIMLLFIFIYCWIWCCCLIIKWAEHNDHPPPPQTPIYRGNGEYRYNGYQVPPQYRTTAPYEPVPEYREPVTRPVNAPEYTEREVPRETA